MSVTRVFGYRTYKQATRICFQTSSFNSLCASVLRQKYRSSSSYIVQAHTSSKVTAVGKLQNRKRSTMADKVQESIGASLDQGRKTISTTVDQENDTDEQNDDSEDDPDPQNDQEYHYHSGENTFNFYELANIIEKHLKDSGTQMRETPPFSDIPTRQEHNKQQQEIWRVLRTKVAEDDTIPMALFDPPRTYIQVRFAEWPQKGHFCCPCDLHRESLQGFDIRTEKGSKYGITKNLFVERLSRELCGDENGAGWTLGDRYSRPVIDHFDWMNMGGISGDIFAMTKGWVE